MSWHYADYAICAYVAAIAGTIIGLWGVVAICTAHSCSSNLGFTVEGGISMIVFSTAFLIGMAIALIFYFLDEDN